MAAAQDARPRPVATMMDLMLDWVTPVSNAVFDSAIEPPTDDEDWTALARKARLLAESGNLLMMPERARDSGAWLALAREQVESTLAAVRAIEAKDLEGLSKASDAIYDTCTKCHNQYMNAR
jgi:hypothetical protein